LLWRPLHSCTHRREQRLLGWMAWPAQVICSTKNFSRCSRPSPWGEGGRHPTCWQGLQRCLRYLSFNLKTYERQPRVGKSHLSKSRLPSFIRDGQSDKANGHLPTDCATSGVCDQRPSRPHVPRLWMRWAGRAMGPCQFEGLQLGCYKETWRDGPL